MGNSMKKLPDGSYRWVAHDWFKRMRRTERQGKLASKLNVALVKMGTSHNLRPGMAHQFIDHLVRMGDHEAAWATITPKPPTRIAVTGLHTVDALSSIRSIERFAESSAEKRLDAIRRIIRDEEPAKALDLIWSIVGGPQDDL